MRLAAYSARVITPSGALVECIARGSTARAALTNLRRSRRGDWTRIEVGVGSGEAFRALAELNR